MRRVILIYMFLLAGYISAQEVEEFRAVWLTNVDSYVLNTDNNIAEAMDYLSSVGINVVFPVVYNKGYTLYPSAIMDSLFGQPTIPDNSFNSRDFLKRLVIEAHRNGIEVIPWFEFGFSSSYSRDGGHIVDKFPSWALENRNGNLVVKNGFDWLSGINPEVQDYMLGLIMEVIRNYDVDGVQGDDRLPAMPVEGGYDEATASLYKSEHDGSEPPYNYNDAEWKSWRAGKLTEYLGRIRDSVKAVSENLVLSVSPSPYYWGYGEYLQDSKTWAKQDLLDNIVPQLYQYSMANYEYALNTTWNDVGKYDPDDFYAGVLARIGSYVISKELLADMINANRNKGVNGECFFFYEALRADDNTIGDFLASEFYSEPAIPPYRNGNIWRPKALIVNEDSNAVKQTGTWDTYNMNGYEGAILRNGNSPEYASLTYNFSVENGAYYDVYIYRTPNFTWTSQANYTLYSVSDSQKVIVDQGDFDEKGWSMLGTVYLESGSSPVVKVDNSGLEDGKYVISDAVMLMINRKLSPEVIVNVKENRSAEVTPENFRLRQNYPNPFNPSTNISFSLPARSRVTLTVYDILGNEVASLVDGYSDSGEYNVTFNAEGLSSGIYFYRLKSGSIDITRKMTLLK